MCIKMQRFSIEDVFVHRELNTYWQYGDNFLLIDNLTLKQYSIKKNKFIIDVSYIIMMCK